MSHQQQSGDKYERLSKEEVLAALLAFEFPASIARGELRSADEALEAKQRRNLGLSVLDEVSIRAVDYFAAELSRHPVIEQNPGFLGELQRDRDASIEVYLSNIKRSMLQRHQEIFGDATPGHSEQYQLQELREQNDAEAKKFLESEKGKEFKSLLQQWCKLEEYQEPKAFEYRDLLQELVKRPIDTRDVENRLQVVMSQDLD
jgi:hypothetical protein